MMNTAIIDQISRMLGVRSVSLHSMSGGTWSSIFRVESPSHPPLVAKIGPFENMNEERQGLRALRDTNTVLIPEVFGFDSEGDHAVLVLEYLELGTDPDWGRFATELAALHRPGVESRYGFMIDNHLGSTVQRNSWTGDWAEFNRSFRHGPLLRSSNLESDDRDLVQRAIDSFTTLLGNPRPALIHGDLWSGNALALADGSVALIDPAPSYGDPLADLAMMELFGGFPDMFFDAYYAESLVESDERKLAAYRLYHALNHLHLFGPGYLDMVRREARLILD